MSGALESLLRNNPALYKAMLDQVACEKSLYQFVKSMWHTVEPANPFVGGWMIECICEHLEAVSRGEIKRLLMNVPPGCAKSLLTDVMWPAWEWGPQNMPHMRYLATSYSSALTERDNGRFRSVVTSESYRAMWGDRFKLTRDSVTKMENNKTGFKLATSTEGLGTGERANRVLVDDPHNVQEGESDTVRKSTLRYFTEVLPTRVTDPKTSAFVVIMQRVHEEDVSGYILKNDLGYDHLMLPMKYEEGYPVVPTSIGFVDPRSRQGELLFPERFPREVVERDEKVMGPYAVSGQFQQRPTPRGGGIIKNDWWQLWPPSGEAEPDKKLEYPVMDFIIASVDTAFKKDGEGDFNALVVLGLWKLNGLPKIMLMNSWQKRLDFRGVPCPPLPGETPAEHIFRSKKTWGMAEWTAYECKRFAVDTLLIENKASGITLSQEIKKIYSNERWSTILIDPRGDKIARAYSVQHIWAEGMCYAPDRAWADEAIDECAKFPKGAHDDIPDACFVAGTVIVTRRGSVPIEHVTRADSVLTPDGWRRVVACGCTGKKRVVSMFGLIGTENHPIFQLNLSYQEMQKCDESKLVRNDLCGWINIILLKAYYSMASRTCSWEEGVNIIYRDSQQMQDGKIPKACMSLFGNFIINGQYRKALKFITAVITHSIAILTILSALGWRSIAACIKEIAIQLFIGRSWKSTVRKSLNDMDLKRAREIENLVYNLEVEDAHCYFANGILVHNCIQGVRWLRDSGWAIRRDEIKVDADRKLRYKGKQEPLYPV